MPEGDTIWIIASHLHEALAGEVLTRSDFRVPRFATVDLSGRPVEEVVARGKHLLLRVGSDLTVHSHLGMEGFWRVLDAGRRPGGQPAWTIRVVLATASKQAVGYGLPVLEVIERAAEAEILGHLGPDLLGPDWNPRRPYGGCSPSLTGPSARHCSTSATSRESAMSTSPSCASCVARLRGRPLLRWVTSSRGSTWPTGCSRPTGAATIASPRRADRAEPTGSTGDGTVSAAVDPFGAP